MTPRRRIAAAALAVAAVLGLAACGGDSAGPAAVVGGTEISQQDVVDELEAIRSNTTYVQAFEQTGTPVVGQEQDTFNSAFVARQLSIRIQFEIVGNEVDRRGLEADDECRAAARGSLADRLAGFAPDGDGESILGAFPESYQDYLVDRETDLLLLQGDLVGEPCVADDAVATYYEENTEQFEQACANHILLDTPEAAQEVFDLLQAGGDFAALAAERSLDPGSNSAGGELPCVTRGQFLEEFEEAIFTAEPGELVGPVETAAGFHVIRVRERRTPPLSEVREQVAQSLAAEAENALNAWFLEQLDVVDVTVDPRYGTWDSTTATIERPPIDEVVTSTTTAPPVP